MDSSPLIKFNCSRLSVRRGWVFITTHAHDDTGDLYVAKNLCDTVPNVSRNMSNSILFTESFIITVLQRCHHRPSEDVLAEKGVYVLYAGLWGAGQQSRGISGLESISGTASIPYLYSEH